MISAPNSILLKSESSMLFKPLLKSRDAKSMFAAILAATASCKMSLIEAKIVWSPIQLDNKSPKLIVLISLELKYNLALADT